MTYAAPDIVDLDITSKAAITAVIAEGNMAGGTYGDWASYVNKYSADNLPVFDVDPANGLHYLRCGSDPTHGTRLISWFLNLNFIKQAPRQELYLRYALYPEADVATGMNELGVKLPGLGGTATKETLSLRMEHGKLIAGTAGDYPFVSYWYDAESGAGFGEILPMGTAPIAAGRWNVIEQRVKLNSITPASGATAAVANKDGEGDVWLDDVLAWSTRAKRWRYFVETLLDQAHINIYHGGTTPPKGPIHYRIARIALSTQRIGMPPELAAPPVVVDPPPIIVVTPPPSDPSPPDNQDPDMATQAQILDVQAKCQATIDAINAAMATPDPRDAEISDLQKQLAAAAAANSTLTQQLASAQSKLAQLNIDIDAAQAKDA